jgi:hypothetical protein
MFSKIIKFNKIFLKLGITVLLGEILLRGNISNFSLYMTLGFLMNMTLLNLFLLKKEKMFPEHDYIIFENGEKKYNYFVVNKDVFSFIFVILSCIDAIFFYNTETLYLFMKTAVFVLTFYLKQDKITEIYLSIKKPKVRKQLSKKMKDFLLPESIEQEYVKKMFLKSFYSGQ